MAKAQTLQLTTWTPDQTAFMVWGANITFPNGVARIPVTSAYETLIAPDRYDLTESHFMVELVTPANNVVGANAIQAVSLDTDNYVYISVNAGEVSASYVAAAVNTWGGAMPYNASRHTHVRIREAGGTLFFEIGTGTEWDVIYSRAAPFALTNVELSLQGGDWGGNGAAAGYAEWGAVNTLAAPPAGGTLSPATLHLKKSDGSWSILTVRLLPFSEHAATTTSHTYIASDAMIANPDRGWYQYSETHWSTAAGAGHVPLDAATLTARRTGTETINGYSVPPRTLVFRYYIMEHMMGVDTIPQAFLDAVQADFDATRAAGTRLVLRFSYSNDGTTGSNTDENGPYNTDTTVERTLSHVAQLKPLIAANTDVIYALQAGFIGTWGEWYYTDYWGNKGTLTTTDWHNRARLVTALLNWGVDFVLLRYVGFKRRYMRERSGPGWAAPADAAARLGFHNDAFQASEDNADWGTFTTGSDGMTVTQARDYLATETARPVPMVGETAGISSRSTYTATTASLAEHHWSALNPSYHLGVLGSWTTAEKDDISRRLGYRFRLTTASLPTSGMPGAVGTVTLNITNDGYAAPTSRNPLHLVFNGPTTVTRDLGVDIRTLGPGSHTITRDVALPAQEGDYTLHLAMPGSRTSQANRPEYAIQLANTTTWADGRNNLAATAAVALPVLKGWEDTTEQLDANIRSSTTTTINTGGTTTTKPFNIPLGVQPGDLLVAYLSVSSGSLANASTLLPAGWTELGRVVPSATAIRHVVFYKVAGASEPASYNYGSLPTTVEGATLCVAVRDWSGNTADIGTTGNGGFAMSANNATNLVAPSITPRSSRSLLLTSAASSNSSGAVWGWIPPNTAGAAQFSHNTPNYYASQAVSHEVIAGTAATGTRAWSVNTASTQTLYMTSALSIASGTRTVSITRILADQFKTLGSGGDLVDATDLTFTDSTGLASTYHLYAEGLDWSKDVGLVVYTDGSGETGLATPTSSYVVGGAGGMRAVAKRQNMVLLTPRAPGDGCTDGDGVCWYAPSYNGVTPHQKLEWSNELIRYVLTRYNIDRRRIAVGGYSSGAQWTTAWWGPKYGSEVMADGVAVAISYGGQPQSTPRLTDAYKAAVEHVWDVGDADDSYTKPTWDNGVQTGRAWYQNNGFATTDLVLLPGVGHNRYDSGVIGDFGRVMEREIVNRVPVAGPEPTTGLRPVTYRSHTSTAKNPADADKTAPMPFIVRTGDLIMCLLSVYNGTVASAALPSGFTQIATHTRSTAHRSIVGYRVATGSEPATYTPTLSGTQGYRMDLIVFGNVDVARLGTPATVTTTGSTTTHPAPSVTPTTGNGALLSLISGAGANTWTPPDGMDEVTDAPLPTPTFLTQATALQPITSAAATGTRTFTTTPMAGSYTHIGISMFLPALGS